MTFARKRFWQGVMVGLVVEAFILVVLLMCISLDVK